MNAQPIQVGHELLATIPDGVKIVGMVVHNNVIVIATETAVYWLDDDAKVFRPIQIVTEADG